MAPLTEPDFVRRIERTPDALESYAAFADWLEDRGDPTSSARVDARAFLRELRRNR